MHVLVVEPHGDDALISAFTTLYCKGLSVDILTCSERDSDDLSTYLKVTTVYLDTEDLNLHLREKVDTHEINRLYKEGQHVFQILRSKVKSDVGEVAWSKADRELTREVSDIGGLSNYDYCLLPLGLDHPYHMLVNEVMSRFGFERVIYYADKPYLAKRYCRQALDDYFKLHPVYQSLVVRYTPEISNEKRKIFAAVYPSEQSLLRFTSDSILLDPDIYISTPATLKSFQILLDSEEGLTSEINDYNKSES